MKQLIQKFSLNTDTLFLLPVCFFSSYFLHPGFSVAILVASILMIPRKENKLRLGLIIFIFLAGMAIEKRDAVIIEKTGDFYSVNLKSEVIKPFRNRLSDLTNRSHNREFLKALTTGKREFSGKFRSLLINSGTMHLVAISAFHVGVFFIILNLIFFRFLNVFLPFKPSKVYLITLVFKLTVSGYYFFITGGSIPTLRAITFILAFELFTFYGFLPNPMTVFLLSLMSVSILIPASAVSLSFIMSAICVATVLNIWKNMPGSVTVRLITVSVLINYALLPVTCELNGCFSLSAPFINLLIIPMMFMIIPVISLAQFTILFSDNTAAFFLKTADFLLNPLMFNLNFFSEFSQKTLFPVIEPSFFIKTVFIITFFSALLLRGRVKKASAVINICLAIFFFTNWVDTWVNPYGFMRPEEFFSRASCVIHEDGTGSIFFDKYRYNPKFSPYFYNNLERSAAQCGITEVNSIHFPQEVNNKIKEIIRKRLRFRNCRFYSKEFTDRPEKNRPGISALRFSDPFL